MSARIQIRRRVNSGNIHDEGLHRQRIADLEARREAAWGVLSVAVGVGVFLVLVLVL